MANRAAHDIALLVRTAGFHDDHHLTIARRDLEALLSTDGLGGELLRLAGRLLANPATGLLSRAVRKGVAGAIAHR